MKLRSKLIKDLDTLNKIVEILNQATDVQQALEKALVRLVDLMGLKTGWIFLKDSAAQNRWAGKGFVLAAHYNLPPAMAPGRARPWKGGCDCQTLCNKGQLIAAYNEVRCSRLLNAPGDRRGLVVHASAPLRSGDKTLGILNVAGPDWDSFSQESLVVLTTIGSQMGITLDRARLFYMLQEQRIHEQSALLELSNQLLSRSDLDELISYLAETVRRLLQADACAILLPHNEAPDTLAFYAASGWFSDPVAERRLMPADERSGPGMVMHMQQPLLVEDLTVCDPAPWTDDWVQAEEFKGHAVVPLIAQGCSIGALVIDMRQPRLLNENELRFLRLMANQAAIAIEKARLHREEIKRQRLEEELAVARHIQYTLLPETCPALSGWDFAAYYKPARLVGGDFYDFFELSGKPSRLGLVIADVADKGVPAALFMALSRSIIRTKAMTGANPVRVLSRANRLIAKDTRSGLFVTVFYAILDIETGHLTFTNAGHNRPLWWQSQSARVQELATTGIVLGVFERVKLGRREIQVSSGDVLVFYTDGVTEAMNEEQHLFGQARLIQAVADGANGSAQHVLDKIIAAVKDFTGDTSQSDDFTIFVVKRS